MKLLSIYKGVLLKDHLQNYQYKVIRPYNSVCEFIIDDFSLMNPNDLITLAYMIKMLHDKHVPYKKVYVIGYGYLKSYIDLYLAHVGLSSFEIVKA